jgi:hypothetical protein
MNHPISPSLQATKTPGRGRVYESITDTIGDTPLVKSWGESHDSGQA